MSDAVDTPEVLDFLGIATSLEVACEDKTKGLLQGLNDAIHKAGRKAFHSRKQTSVTMTLKFSAVQDKVEITGFLNWKEPKPESLSMQAYVDDEGRLFADDPGQTKLSLQTPNPT